MFGKLIYVIFAVLGLVVIDNFSTFIAVVICGFLIYLYFHILSKELNKDHIVISITIKCLSYIFTLWKNIILILKNVFSGKELKDSHHYNWEHCGEKVCLEKEVDCLVSYISQHYLDSWYSKVGDNEEFILHLNSIIKCTLLNLCTKVTTVDREKTAYTILQIYLHFFIHFIDSKKKSDLKVDEFEMKHWASQDNLKQWCYLQSLVSSLIDNYGPTDQQNSLHSKHSPILHNFIVEILTEHILYPLSNLLSDPSQLNSWLLRVVETYIQVDGDCESNSKDYPPCYETFEEYNIGPKILLESEDYFTDTETQTNGSNNELTLSDKNNKNDTLIPSLYHFNKRNSDCLSPVMSSTVKSSSNINLLDHTSRASKSQDCSPISSDASKIKRSKSADYICQMPQLRPLNMKDYNIMKNENDKMLVAVRSDLSSSGLIEQAEEAVEIPTLFSDIQISDTVQQSEAGILPYTLYCIQYSGVFHDTRKSSDKPHFIKQEINIKRRFREFLALQSRLEDNPSLKFCLKGIKGPSKWFALPFSNMDKKNIAERKSFLENYLKELCKQGPIAHSSELQEFLAYGGDATVAFVKKAADISVPRLDKMLVRGVKGAIDMFKIDIPGSSENSSGVFSSDSTITKTSSEDSFHIHKFPEHLLEYSSREPDIRIHLRCYIKNASNSIPEIQCLKKSVSMYDYPQRASILRQFSKLKIESACQCSTSLEINDNNFAHEANCLGNSVFDILIKALPICQVDSFYSILKFLISPTINQYFLTMLEEFSENNLALVLHILHEVLWPTKCNSSDDGNVPLKYSSNLDKLKECLKVLISSSNVIMNISYIQNQSLDWIYLFLSSIQHQELNKCLLFHLFDVIIETMCSSEN